MQSPDKHRRLTILVWILVVVFHPVVFAGSSTGVSITPDQSAAQRVTRLSKDSTQEREISEAETHIYELSLSAGEFLRVTIEGPGADLSVSLSKAEGSIVAEVSTVIGFLPKKRLSFVSRDAGDYRLTLRGARKGPARRYALKVTDWRPVEPKDESSVSGERAYDEAVRLEFQNNAEATARAIEKYEEATKQFHAAGDRACEAFTLMKTGLSLHNLSRLKEAIGHHGVALKIFEELGDELGISHTLTSIGWSYSGLSKFKESLNYCQRALEIRRRLGDPRAIAQTLNLVAAAYQELGDERLAIERYLEAIQLAKKGKDPSIEAYALNGVAWLYIQAGEFEKAVESADQALPLWRSVGNILGEAQSLHLRGTSYSNRVYTSEAIESFEQALAIWRRVGNKFGEGQALNNMGLHYMRLGDYERAKGLCVQAFEIWKAMDNRGQQARILDNLGLIEWRLGRLHESLGFFEKSLAILVADGKLPQQAGPLLNSGNVHALLGNKKQGLENIRRALQISRETGQRDLEHDALNDLGHFLMEQGDEEGALDCYRQAFLSIPARLNRAWLEAKRGNLVTARSIVEETISRNQIGRRHIPNQDLRVSFGDRTRSAYEMHCEILMLQYQESLKTGQPAETLLIEAFKASEYARARGLLEALAESQADIRSGADLALIAEERRLEERLNARDTKRNQLLNVADGEDRLSAINTEIQELGWQLSDVRGRIRSRYPEYSALIEPQAPNLSDIQKALDEDTIFLEYFLGKEKSFLWLLTSDSIHSYVLPDRATLESKAQEFYELLSASSQEQTSNSVSSKPLATHRRIGTELARELLGPVSSRLGTKRLVIVADGVLQYIPFGALPVPGPNLKNSDIGKSSSAYQPLIVDHEIINVPSGAVLAALRSHSLDRTRPKKELAVFADAVYSKDDPRLNPSQAVQKNLPTVSARSNALRGETIADDAGLPSFVRLRFSRHEANAITSLVPATEKLEALDFAANKSTVQSAALGDYRILHFATHGLLNSLHPDLSGLVFSLVDQQGKSQDGFLRSYEIYNLKLNADLVVLSGCQTALGKYAKSEGLIGLTRGFMYAGVPRVVASLWRVDDRGTAELMKRFYRGMLQQKLSPPAALRAAQVSMLSEPRWSASHYWAPFTIQGEWK